MQTVAKLKEQKDDAHFSQTPNAHRKAHACAAEAEGT